MNAKELYNKKALKHQLKRAIKYDYEYYESCIIEIMEEYAKQKEDFANVVSSFEPTNEDIEKEARKRELIIVNENDNPEDELDYRSGVTYHVFKQGAKWMLDKLKAQH